MSMWVRTLLFNYVFIFLISAFATAFGDFVMHPIDTIKILQQSSGMIFYDNYVV